MTFSEFYSYLTKYAPLELSKKLCEKDGMYDNSGIILDMEKNADVSGIVFTLDLTSKSVEFATENGCNLIVTHHPAIYSPIKRLECGDAVYSAAKSGIGVISMHLNFDCAERGIDYYLAEGLGAKEQKIVEVLGENVGYGRIFDVDGLTADGLLERFKSVFATQKAFIYGGKAVKIHRIASFCGAGLDECAIEAAIFEKADAVVSADIKHHVLVEAVEKGLAVLSCTHYSTEYYGMKKICENFAKNHKNQKIIFYDDERFL